MLYYGAILLAIGSTTLYHLFQKATPANVHPLVGLAVTYAVATGVCLALLPFYPVKAGLLQGLRRVNWTSAGLGAAIVGIEVGILLAYRAGWTISTTAIVANVSVAVLLVPIGLLVYAERLSTVQVVGIAFCLAGLVMINIR